MHAPPSAPAVVQYRIEAGTGSRCVVGQVDVANGVIVAAPPIWRRWVGQELHKLEWWLTAKYRTSQTRRVGA